jgi:hypothetical protein
MSVEASIHLCINVCLVAAVVVWLLWVDSSSRQSCRDIRDSLREIGIEADARDERAGLKDDVKCKKCGRWINIHDSPSEWVQDCHFLCQETEGFEDACTEQKEG